VYLFCQNTSDLKQLDENKKHFKKIFDKEIQQYDTKHHKLKDTRPEVLPPWINHTTKDNEKLFLLGISDPGLEMQQAKVQALHRIKLIYCLLSNPTIKILNDIYSKEYNESHARKYESFSKINASDIIDTSSIQIIKQHTTKYDELILLASIEKMPAGKKYSDSVIVNIEHIVVDLNIDDDFENQKAIDIHSCIYSNNKESKKYDYTYKRIGSHINISSFIDNAALDIPELPYNYEAQDSTVTDSTATIYKINNGLWNGYIEAIISQMHHLAYQDETKIQTMNDGYDKKVYQDLNRYVTKSNENYYIKKCLVNEEGVLMELWKDGKME